MREENERVGNKERIKQITNERENIRRERQKRAREKE